MTFLGVSHVPEAFFNTVLVVETVPPAGGVLNPFYFHYC